MPVVSSRDSSLSFVMRLNFFTNFSCRFPILLMKFFVLSSGDLKRSEIEETCPMLPISLLKLDLNAPILFDTVFILDQDWTGSGLDQDW